MRVVMRREREREREKGGNRSQQQWDGSEARLCQKHTNEEVEKKAKSEDDCEDVSEERRGKANAE